MKQSPTGPAALDLEDLAYRLERARQIVNLKMMAELAERDRQAESSPLAGKWPVTTCLELAESILSEVVGELLKVQEAGRQREAA